MTGRTRWKPLCVGAFSRADRKLKNLVFPRFKDGAEAPSFSLESKRAFEKAERDSFASIIREFRAFLFPRDVAQAYNLAFPRRIISWQRW